MKKSKQGIIVLVVIAVLCGGLFLWEHMSDKHDEELLQTAKNVDIGDGVTLARGLQAFCGTRGDWYLPGDDTVEVVAIGNENSVTAELKVNVKTGDVDVLKFYYDVYLLNSDDTAAVISDMIKAAKK